MAVVLEEVGHGQIFTGTGFQPDTPLMATFDKGDGNPQTVGEETFRDLHSDIRGAFEMHLFASRKDIGDATFTVTDGSCVAVDEFTTPADRFPEVECTPEEPSTDENQASEDYETSVLADEPTSYWRFEEESGDETQSSDGVAAEPMNDVVLGQPGFIDGSRSVLLIEWTEEVEGSDVGGWLDIPDIELDEDFTIEAWYRFCGRFIWFQDVLVGQSGVGPNVNFFEWHAHLYDGASDVLISPQTVSGTGWHHLAITRAAGTLTMYEDGDQTASSALADPLPIGAIGYGKGNGFEGSFGGWLDEVAFYDHALTMEEIAEHAAFGE